MPKVLKGQGLRLRLMAKRKKLINKKGPSEYTEGPYNFKGFGL
jgi:hypothetical protein